MGMPSLEPHVGHGGAAALLATPGLDPMPTSPTDLRGDQPSMALTAVVADAAAQALESGQTHYVDVPGIAPLREATARLLADQGAPCRAANLLITAGAQEARFLALQVLGNLSGPLAVPQVVHPGVRQALGVRGLQTISVPVDQGRGMLPDPAAIGDALAQGAQLVYLESPSRLTGATYSAGDWTAIKQLVAEYGAGVIVDQGLAPWAEGRLAGAALGSLERVALLGELLPGQGLESWQIGYIAADESWLPPLQSQKQIMAICTSTPSQYAALATMEAAAEVQHELGRRLRAHAAEVRALAFERGLAALPGDAGSVVALRPADAAVALSKLAAQGYSAADGAAFGAPGVLRFAVRPDQDFAAVISALV